MPARLILSGIVRGSKNVIDSIGRGIIVTRLLFNQKRLERLFIGRIKGRFGTPGSGPTAQHDPDGMPWPKLKPSTTRFVNFNRSQKLVDTGRLRDSIGIVRSSLGPSVLASSVGGNIIIGIKPGFIDVLEYANIHNEGGISGAGGNSFIPKRRYLGIGKGDELAADSLIRTVQKLSGLR